MPTPTDNMTAFQIKQELRYIERELRMGTRHEGNSQYFEGLKSRDKILKAALKERGLDA